MLGERKEQAVFRGYMSYGIPTSANMRVPLALATLAPVKHGPMACRVRVQ